MSSKQWLLILVFAFGIIITVLSLFLETLGEYTGGYVGNSNPGITPRPLPPSRHSPIVVASTVALLKGSRKK